MQDDFDVEEGQQIFQAARGEKNSKFTGCNQQTTNSQISSRASLVAGAYMKWIWEGFKYSFVHIITTTLVSFDSFSIMTNHPKTGVQSPDQMWEHQVGTNQTSLIYVLTWDLRCQHKWLIREGKQAGLEDLEGVPLNKLGSHSTLILGHFHVHGKCHLEHSSTEHRWSFWDSLWPKFELCTRKNSSTGQYFHLYKTVLIDFIHQVGETRSDSKNKQHLW